MGAPPRRGGRSRSRFSSFGFGRGAGAGGASGAAVAVDVDVDAPLSLSFSRSRRDFRSTPAPLSAASNWREARPSTGRERREGGAGAEESAGADEVVGAAEATVGGLAGVFEDAAGAVPEDGADAAPLRSRAALGGLDGPCFAVGPFVSLLVPACAWLWCAADFAVVAVFFPPFLLEPTPDSAAFSFALPAPSFFLSPFFVDVAAAANAAGSL